MALSGQGGPEALFDGMARIMLQSQTPSIRNFLLASSTLNRLTPEVCGDALELSGSAQMLMEIQSRNLFVSRVPGALVYHTLFRNFLQAELKQADPDWFPSYTERRRAGTRSTTSPTRRSIIISTPTCRSLPLPWRNILPPPIMLRTASKRC